MAIVMELETYLSWKLSVWGFFLTLFEVQKFCGNTVNLKGPEKTPDTRIRKIMFWGSLFSTTVSKTDAFISGAWATIEQVYIVDAFISGARATIEQVYTGEVLLKAG